MERKKLMEEVAKIRQILVEAMPVGVSFAAIIIALAQLIETYQRRALDLD